MSQVTIAIKVEHLSKKLGKTLALENVNLNFKSAIMHGIIGPEGSGKTTLMRIMLGLLKPDQGNITFIRENPSEESPSEENKKEKDKREGASESNLAFSFEEIRQWVAYMPQQQSLYADLSIQEHLDFFKQLYDLNEIEYQKKSQELLEITRLSDFLERPAGKLSGGMYKKLGLMCALLRSPRVMLLDEPTTGVDPISRREFWDLLYRLLDQKILIVVTTAYMDEAERCSMVHLLESGRSIVEGAPREILKQEGVHNFEELFLRHATRKSKTRLDENEDA